MDLISIYENIYLEKLWSIVDGTKPKPINPTQMQITNVA
jgi:hypothetical protein